MPRARHQRQGPKPASEPMDRLLNVAPERVAKARERMRRIQDASPDYPPEPASTKRSRQAEREIIVTLRLPRDLHARLKELAGERGLTAQIRSRLDASLAMDEAYEDATFAELFRAVGYVVVASAKLYPDDPEAYSIVELAIRLLCDVFRPDGAKDIVHEVYVPTTVQLLGKVERLIGFALGQLGDAGVARAAKLPVFKIPTEGSDR